jgi:hypothetical protein
MQRPSRPLAGNRDLAGLFDPAVKLATAGMLGAVTASRLAKRYSPAWATIGMGRFAITDWTGWSERRDSNPRPPVPQTDALPGCATLRPRGCVVYQPRRLTAMRLLAWRNRQAGVFVRVRQHGTV